MEIERTTLIGAPYYINQIEIIKSVAKSLPINFKLFVKEHPGQILRSWRSISEYKDNMNIPNVELLHPNFPKDELYKKCSIVFSIAGTAGFEAACYGKPSITLIDLNYSLLPSVSKLKSFEDLNSLIQKKILEKVNVFTFQYLLAENKLSKSINPYGDGNSSQRIVNIILKTKITNNFLSKHLTY